MISICFIYFGVLLFSSILLFVMSIIFMGIDYSVLIEVEFLSFNSNIIFMSLLFDWMSLLFMSFVLFISSMVIFYSYEYMGGDLNINRFILLVFMFVASMMFLIVSPNLISILLGWDGLGLVSYCLVVYYQNVKSFNAGMLTALSNRIGDVALLISIAWMLNYGDWNYIYYLDFMKNDFSMEVIGWLVLLAAMTKSAQIPFSSWLPAAMAAPTPVSALVHSSTLVTAGVYLLIRFNFVLSSGLMVSLFFISGMTMFMAGLGANYEFDLKKIIALSTLSQLGLMMSVLALGEYMLAFFHLLTHALFKALLFMCAGCMIHNLGNHQDIRFMGSLVKQMPLTCCFFNICNMALCGLPFMSGFYSKDLILEVFSMGYLNFFMYFVFYFSTGLTVCYSVRLSYYSLFGDYNFSGFHNMSDEGFIMLKGMSGLILLVIFGGSMLMWLMFPTPYFICLPVLMKVMVLFVIFFGIMFGYQFSKFVLSYELKGLKFMTSSLFFASMWNLPYLSTFGVNFYPIKLGGVFYKSMDHGWSEFFGSQNIYETLKMTSNWFYIIFNNNMKIYLSMVVIWIICLIIFG
uniref:NADH dehydrogenase subunit 5 n=1 Tax=Sternocampsus coriaceus TaxID=3041292 RepID=UPI00255200DC|nr:NADH dehydrogenase subunit 5 [Sternocampsus coriaceus]WGF20849.1 NADH dehydrogenase subunit 5 [Sternocampsus coriaceus]